MEAGFDDYLSKPIISEKLENLMLNYLPEDKVLVTDEELSETEGKGDGEEIPSWIKNVPGINVNAGVRHCGSEAAFLDALMTFKNSMEDNYGDIKRFFEGEDIENYTIKVHALKSSSRVIGLKGLSKLSAELEAAGDVNDISQIKEDTPKLLSMYKEIIDAFPDLEEADEDENLPLMDESQIKDALNAIKEITVSFDYDSISYIMETVDGFRVPKEHKKLFKDLKKAVAAADWDAINELLETGGNDG